MACSKIFSGDLPELISEILQYFRNDFSTLYSCILVNRLWCRISIPLLWEDPFSKNISENCKNHPIEIYLHKLCKEDKVKLNEYGINNDSFPSNTLFNYPSFIKRLDTFEVYSFIEIWAKRAMTSNFNQRLRLLSFIFLTLIKTFIENKANLHTFEFILLYNGIANNDYFKSAFQLILQNPNFICNVKKLIIHLNNYGNLSPFLKCFYSNCNSILSIYIHQFIDEYIENSLFKIINSQQNLKKIHITYNIYLLKSLKNSNCSNTLKTIIFYKIYFEKLKVNFNEIFEQLNVLESIHILYCYLSNNFIQQIINLSKPYKLKSLLMNKSSVLEIEQLKLLLQKSGGYLENIEFMSSISNELKLELFKLIKVYCIKIKFIILLRFDGQNIFSALDLIKNQQSLNYLEINFCQFGYVSQLYYDNKLSSIILQHLGQVLPNRLEYLSLSLKFNINDLEVFFKNTQNIFIKKLLIKNKFYQECEDILPCIKKHVMKEKRATYLAIENILFHPNMGRKDLFDLKDDVKEFKSYGIEVTKYSDLYIQICDFINELY